MLNLAPLFRPDIVDDARVEVLNDLAGELVALLVEYLVDRLSDTGVRTVASDEPLGAIRSLLFALGPSAAGSVRQTRP